MLKQILKNQGHKGGQGFPFSLKPLALSLRSLAFCLFFIFCLLNANTTFAATVNLSWTPPTANTDGSQLTDLAGYRVYYGTLSGYYTQQIDAGNVTTYTLSNLTDGTTYYIAITAYNTSLRESDYSNERCFNSIGNCSSDRGIIKKCVKKMKGGVSLRVESQSTNERRHHHEKGYHRKREGVKSNL